MSENPFLKIDVFEKSKLSLEEKRRRLRKIYEDGLKAGGWRIMQELTTDRGDSLERTFDVPAGTIKIDHNRSHDGTVYTVEIDRGMVVIGESVEMMTKELSGCQAVFVHGKTKNNKIVTGLFHLTPTSNLPWGNFKVQKDDEKFGHVFRQAAVEKIVAAMEKVYADPAVCPMYLIRNEGDVSEKKFYWGYDETHLQRKSFDLKEQLEAYGYGVRIIDPLPLASTTVYWSSNAPLEMFVVGAQKSDARQNVKEMVISL